MKIYVVNIGGENKYFSNLRKAQRAGNNIRVVNLDIDSLPHEGCTLEDIDIWSDAIDSWLVD